MEPILKPIDKEIIGPVIALDEFPPTADPPSGDWIVDDFGNYVVDEDYNFLYG